jgi:hypothetical protein
MGWIYCNTSDDKYRYALGNVQDKPNKLLFVVGVNPSYATPQKLDPTAKRIEKIAKEHGYDSWIILNVYSQRATKPNEMDEEQDLIRHNENIEIITNLFSRYCQCSDVLFAYGDLISKRNYLKKNLCEIMNIIKTNKYGGGCFCLGKTKLGNARHPLYQKIDTQFVPFSLEGHTYSEMYCLEDNGCVIRECSENGDIILETWGICN